MLKALALGAITLVLTFFVASAHAQTYTSPTNSPTTTPSMSNSSSTNSNTNTTPGAPNTGFGQ